VEAPEDLVGMPNTGYFMVKVFLISGNFFRIFQYTEIENTTANFDQIINHQR
jgi:hypothetical protein